MSNEKVERLSAKIGFDTDPEGLVVRYADYIDMKEQRDQARKELEASKDPTTKAVNQTVAAMTGSRIEWVYRSFARIWKIVTNEDSPIANEIEALIREEVANG